MADLDQQIRGYASGLDLGDPIDPTAIVRAAPRHHDTRSRWPFLAAAAVLVVVVLGAAVVALRDDATEEPAPTVDTTVVPQGWERIAEVDGAQPFAMAASGRGVVMVGYGAWWSADGSAWEEGFVTDLVGADPVRPDLMSDVIATDDGYLAVGTGYDKQPTVWRSADGRSWDRVVDDDLAVPPRSIPEEVSTPYGAINAVVGTEDGLVAVGSVFDGTFVGDTLTSPDPSRPAVWTSVDGTDWVRIEDLPDGDGSLVAATVVDDEVVAVGTTADTSYVWRGVGKGRGWSVMGEIEGTASDVAEIGGTLVVSGARNADRQATPTIWSSEGGSTWSVAHEEPESSIATFTSLVEDGDLLLALGYTGPGELDVEGLLLTSSDGTTWTAGPALGNPPVTCDLSAGSGQHCPTATSYPETGTLLGEELLLVTIESVTTSYPANLPTTRLRAGIHRGLSTTPASPPPPGVVAEIVPPEGPIPAGGMVDTFVTVRNDTGAPITVTGCGGPFAVVLANDEAQQLDVRTACLVLYDIPAGTSRWPVTILGSHNFCTSTPDTVGCGALPGGTYTATVPPEGPIAPPPIQVEVR